MIIGSIAPPPTLGWLWGNAPSMEVVPLAPAKLSYADHTLLTSLGLPEKKRDNLNALLALYNEAKNIFGVLISKPGAELSRSFVLKEIEFFLQNAKKDGELAIYLTSKVIQEYLMLTL